MLVAINVISRLVGIVFIFERIDCMSKSQRSLLLLNGLGLLDICLVLYKNKHA